MSECLNAAPLVSPVAAVGSWPLSTACAERGELGSL